MEVAREEGICSEGYGHIREYDRNNLVKYYTTNPDWCLERDYPSLDILRREFSNLEADGVFVDKVFDGKEVFDKLQTYIFHNCKGTINVAMDYDHAVIPMLYFANGCDVKVVCTQNNAVPIKVPIYVVKQKGNKVSMKKSENWCFIRYYIKPVKK